MTPDSNLQSFQFICVARTEQVVFLGKSCEQNYISFFVCTSFRYNSAEINLYNNFVPNSVFTYITFNAFIVEYSCDRFWLLLPNITAPAIHSCFPFCCILIKNWTFSWITIIIIIMFEKYNQSSHLWTNYF